MASKRIVFSPAQLLAIYQDPDLFDCLMEVLKTDINRPVGIALDIASHAKAQFKIIWPDGAPGIDYSIDVNTGEFVVKTPIPKPPKAVKP